MPFVEPAVWARAAFWPEVGGWAARAAPGRQGPAAGQSAVRAAPVAWTPASVRLGRCGALAASPEPDPADRCWVPPGGDCPTYYPNLGSTCALPAGTSCRYTCASIVVCTAEGVWVDGGDRCPECNAPDTPIATPAGNRPIASLVPGDLVYSIHRGEVAVVPIAGVGRKAQRDHHVVRVALATGVVLEISPRHPTADGRTIGDLAADDVLDGVRVASAALRPYRHSHTYDILPASDTGTYYAGGVLIGSTMAPRHRLDRAPSPLCLLPASK